MLMLSALRSNLIITPFISFSSAAEVPYLKMNLFWDYSLGESKPAFAISDTCLNDILLLVLPSTSEESYC